MESILLIVIQKEVFKELSINQMLKSDLNLSK